MFFEMDRGLYDKVGFSSSSRVDGSVSYTITIRAAGMKGPDQDVVKVSASVQGNINESDLIRWCHAISFPEMKKSEDTFEDVLIETIVQVTDFNVFSKSNGMRLKVMFTGYEFFEDSRENRTAELIAA